LGDITEVSTQVGAPSPLREKAGMRGDLSILFYSPHPSPLQQERKLGVVATHYYYAEKLCRYLCLEGENWNDGYNMLILLSLY
jgi:hypothetical protein